MPRAGGEEEGVEGAVEVLEALGEERGLAFGGGGGGGGGGNDPVFNLSVVITVSLCAIGAAGIAYKCKKKYCDKHDYNKKDQDDGAAQVGNWEDFGEEPEGARVPPVFLDLNKETSKDFLAAAASEEDASVRCHLCSEQIKLDSWETGEHRRSCALKHRAVLSEMQVPFPDCRCARCGEGPMRLWPRNRGREFTCDGGADCPCGQGAVVNSGANRLCCFGCDYNLCRTCCQARQQQQQVLAQEAPPPPYSTAEVPA